MPLGARAHLRAAAPAGDQLGREPPLAAGDRPQKIEVEVRFIAQGAHRTRVELEHRYLDRHGDGWEQMHDAVGSSGGWPAGMRALTKQLQTQSPTT
jgi:hypothetical protein